MTEKHTTKGSDDSARADHEQREGNPYRELEAKWSARWRAKEVYKAEDFSPKPKQYILGEFPYPSGAGLHMGHVMRYTAPEILSRKLRMSGFNVLFPMGWDAFGLPAENYAIKTGVHPSKTTELAIETFTKQMMALGYGIDWSREINSTDPKYYKWTQWLFLKFFEAGLAELREEPVWWCETLKTVLANEEVLDDENGNKISERGGHPVEKRPLRQWVLKITEYADKLLDGLDIADYPESIKLAQRNWIGKSEGARVVFGLEAGGKPVDDTLEVFTTRPDTLFGVTFMALAPEHPLLDRVLEKIANRAEVEQARAHMTNRSSLDRQVAKDKTGVRLEGVHARHPLDPKAAPIPIYIADYILIEYGTGAIMGVPAHDERDFEFATKYGIPVVQTVSPRGTSGDVELPFVEYDGEVKILPAFAGIFDAAQQKAGVVSCEEMRSSVIRALEKEKKGSGKIAYKFRDWIFSRQRFWGEPIPLVHCGDGEIEAIVKTTDANGVKEKLPLLLPEVPDYQPSSDGSSPLARNKEWVNTVDSKGRPAQRETNTMPNWAGSSWYYMRYCDPHNDEVFAAPEKLAYWLPVDRYFGGGEHTTMHLLYSRFWHAFFYDQKLVPTPEPYKTRINGGILLGSDGQKQSKSLGNVVDPLEMVARYGADALRMYICFMGPYDATLPWNENGLKACRKVVDTVFALSDRVDLSGEFAQELELKKALHRLIKRASEMFDAFKLNTIVSEYMIFLNELKKAPKIERALWEDFLKVFAPMAAFTAEALWQRLKGWEHVPESEWSAEHSIHRQSWPPYDPALTAVERVVIGVQVNGKLRGELEVGVDEAADEVRTRVLELPSVQKWMEGKELKKFIYQPGRIISLVV